jgi:hypothetical protein
MEARLSARILIVVDNAANLRLATDVLETVQVAAFLVRGPVPADGDPPWA